MHGTRPSHAVRLLSVAIDDRAQMDGVLAGAGAPETAPMAPDLTVRELAPAKGLSVHFQFYLCIVEESPDSTEKTTSVAW